MLEAELSRYSDEIARKPRWLVFNKLDLIPENEQQHRVDILVEKLDWKRPVYGISGLSGVGTKELSLAVMRYLESLD